MTLAEFRKLKHRDFENGAVIEDIEKVIEQRDALLSAAQFAKSVLEKQGLFEMSERMAVERLDAAIRPL